MSLIKQARLTDEEGYLASGGDPELLVQFPDTAMLGTLYRGIADAQLAKALRAVKEWLDGWKFVSGGPGPLYGAGWEALRGYMLNEVKEEIATEGIERPE